MVTEELIKAYLQINCCIFCTHNQDESHWSSNVCKECLTDAVEQVENIQIAKIDVNIDINTEMNSIGSDDND